MSFETNQLGLDEKNKANVIVTPVNENLFSFVHIVAIKVNFIALASERTDKTNDLRGFA